MKRTKTIFWVSTLLFAGFMIFSAIPDIIKSPVATEFITALGYPLYFVPFIGVAKLMGSIVILEPGNQKIKEWAYAGLTFDLVGAVYSNLMVHGWDNGMLTMIPIFGLLITSYVFRNKLAKSNY